MTFVHCCLSRVQNGVCQKSVLRWLGWETEKGLRLLGRWKKEMTRKRDGGKEERTNMTLIRY